MIEERMRRWKTKGCRWNQTAITLRSVFLPWTGGDGPQCTFDPFISIAASLSSRQRFPLDHQLFIIKRPLADPPPDSSHLMTFRSAEPGLAAHPAFALSFCFNSSPRNLVFQPNSRMWEWNRPCPPWNIDEGSFARRSCHKDAQSGQDRRQSLILGAKLPRWIFARHWLLCYLSH